MEVERPPLGLIPKNIWIYQRLDDIKDAIVRYSKANYPIPTKWFEEYNELIEVYKQLTIK